MPKEAPPPRSPTGGRDAVETRDRHRLRRLALAAIVAGVALRLLAPFVMDIWEDGGEYVAMGHTWAQRHDFFLPFGEGRSHVVPEGPAYSHHYPPAYPVFLGAVFSVFGFGLWQAKLAAVFVSLAAIGVIYLVTRDLYGEHPALLVTGLMALEPHLLWVTGTGYSENMVLLFFALTMWAILKSLKDPRYIVLAGLFAGLSYLSRASVGYFFIVAGLGGLAWRFYYWRWAVFRNVWYMAAIVVFGGIVLSWAGRNVVLFGWPHWQTSLYLSTANTYAFENPGLWIKGLAGKLPFFALTFALYAIPFWGPLKEGFRRIREEATSALLLSIVLVWVLAWLVTGSFWPFEQRPFFYWEHHRYVVIGLIPLAWLVFRETRRSGETLLRWGAVAAGFLVVSAGVLAAPVRYPDHRAAEDLNAYLRPGDTVHAIRMYVYEPYPYLDDPTSITIAEKLPDDFQPEFILVRGHAEPGPLQLYDVVAWYVQHHTFKGDKMATLLARKTVIEERDLPTNQTIASW